MKTYWFLLQHNTNYRTRKVSIVSYSSSSAQVECRRAYPNYSILEDISFYKTY